MPASRKKAATTRLPRSWPSRPILVMRILDGGAACGGDIGHPGGGGKPYGGTCRRRCEEASAGADSCDHLPDAAGVGGEISALSAPRLGRRCAQSVTSDVRPEAP